VELDTRRLFELAREHGNSYYVLDLDRFHTNYLEFAAAFGVHYPKVRLAYSYKTNYTPAICELVRNLGGYAEVVSIMEHDLALRLGVAPIDIVFNGPYKREPDLRRALAGGALVNLDASYELDLVERIAAANTAPLRVGVRCNFDIGRPSRFGFSSEELGTAIARLRALPNVRLAALHCHYDTPQRSVASFVHRAETMIALARDHGLVDTLEMIDLGSGFFSRMSPELRASFHTHVPTYEEYGEAVGRVFAAQFPSGGPWLVLEPGKPIVADTMAFVTRIVEVKRIGERTWIQVAGSVYDVRPTKSARNLPIRHHGPASPAIHAHVVGSTCMEDDVLHRDYEGPAARGDLFVFENVGAYTNVLRPPFILPAAPMLALEGGALRIVRRGDTLDDVLRAYAIKAPLANP
jgi:diaminopimelate decarboxylase